MERNGKTPMKEKNKTHPSHCLSNLSELKKKKENKVPLYTNTLSFSSFCDELLHGALDDLAEDFDLNGKSRVSDVLRRR